MKMKIWQEENLYGGLRLGIKFHGKITICNGTCQLIGNVVDPYLSSCNDSTGGWMLPKGATEKLRVNGSGKLSGFSWEASKICPGDLRKIPLEQVRDFLVEQLEDLYLKLWQWKMDKGELVVSFNTPCKTCGHSYSKHSLRYKGICTVNNPGCSCNGFIPNGKPKKKAHWLKEPDFKYKFNYTAMPINQYNYKDAELSILAYEGKISPEYPINIDKVTGLPVDNPKFCFPKSFVPGYKHCFHGDYKSLQKNYIESTMHCCICKKSIPQKDLNKYA